MSTVKQHNAYLVRKVDRQRRQLGVAMNALMWISSQFCERRPEDHDNFTPCKLTGDCITEWCLPCYAGQAMLDIAAADKPQGAPNATT